MVKVPIFWIVMFGLLGAVLHLIGLGLSDAPITYFVVLIICGYIYWRINVRDIKSGGS